MLLQGARIKRFFLYDGEAAFVGDGPMLALIDDDEYRVGGLVGWSD